MKQDTTGNIWFYRNVPPGTPEGNAVSGNSAMSPDGTLVSFCLRVRFIPGGGAKPIYKCPNCGFEGPVERPESTQ